MGSADEMFSLFDRMARGDGRIRAMTLEGSRVNPSVTPDIWQDYDIAFLVTDVEDFTRSDAWLSAFGEVAFMQKPEAMALFPPDFPEGWFSYLMLLADGVRIDLTLVPLTDVDAYFAQDPLIKVLLDKDGVCPALPVPTDERFRVARPGAAFVADCANEFFLSCSSVAKGLLRGELLFANGVFDEVTRGELLRMLGYLAGARHGFPLNTGKRDKWLPRFLSDGERAKLLATYRLDGIDAAWRALQVAMDLFEAALAEVCATLGCPHPDCAEKVAGYIDTLKALS